MLATTRFSAPGTLSPYEEAALRRWFGGARGYEPARLVVPSSSVRRVFKIVQFDAVWPIFDSLEEARADERATAPPEG